MTLMMRRAKAGEKPEPITNATRAVAAILARKAARWTADNGEALAECEPVMPAAVVNRAADNWKPLASITTLAGDGWPARLAKVMAVKPADDEDGGTLAMLLADIQAIFKARSAERLPTEQIVEDLSKMDDRPWPEMQSGKAITTNKLTRTLKPLDICRKQWRIGGTDERPWGFYLADFAESHQKKW